MHSGIGLAESQQAAVRLEVLGSSAAVYDGYDDDHEAVLGTTVRCFAGVR